MTRPQCDLLDTHKQNRAIWVRLDDEQFEALKEIAAKEKLTLGQMVKKDLLIKLEVKREMREQAVKVFEMLKHPTLPESPKHPSNDCA